MIRSLRTPNIMKHVCVAARIGDSKAPGEGNSRSIAKTSNADSADSGSNPSGWHEFWPMALSKGPLLRMTKPQDFLLALSQNRDSASRVSSCYGLLLPGTHDAARQIAGRLAVAVQRAAVDDDARDSLRLRMQPAGACWQIVDERA